jgi:hypothetical protein
MHWGAASCLLERSLIRQGYSPLTALAVLPLLRRIAAATGAVKDLTVLAAALRKLAPAQAEPLLRRPTNKPKPTVTTGLPPPPPVSWSRCWSLEAVDLQRSALRLCYLHSDPHQISTAHHHLANYLCRASTDPAEQRAHRLTAALLNHLTGDTHQLTTTLQGLASELRNDTTHPHTPALPATLPDITRLIDAINQDQ